MAKEEEKMLNNNTFDVSNSSDNADARSGRETRASGLIDGRTLRKRNRHEQIGLKVDANKKSQLLRLAERLDITMTDVIYRALDEFEAKLNKGKQ